MPQKSKRRRKFRRYLRGGINQTLSFSGLAAAAAVSADFGDTVEDTTFVTSVVATYALNAHTPERSAGPYLIVLAHSDYTDAEVLAFINAVGGWGSADQITREILMRKIKIVGSIRPDDSLEGTAFIEDGRLIKTKLNWLLNEGQTVQVLVINTGTAPQVTTTANLEINGHANLWPQ